MVRGNKDILTTWCHLNMHSFIKVGETGFSVYRGDADGIPVIAKIAKNPSLAALVHEVHINNWLYPIQGDVIPICHGLFGLEKILAVLLLEDCGQSLESFSDLSALTRSEFSNNIWQFKILMAIL
jgi:hypothetical protein